MEGIRMSGKTYSNDNNMIKRRTKGRILLFTIIDIIIMVMITLPTIMGFVISVRTRTRTSFSSLINNINRNRKTRVAGPLWESSMNKDSDDFHKDDWRAFRAQLESMNKDGENFHTDDWRAFRAQLVLNEKEITKNKGGKKKKKYKFFPITKRETNSKKKRQIFIPKKPSLSSWIHEQTVLETGSILVHTPRPQDVCGLARQCLYCSVILIVESNPQKTMGILLNRPTDYCLSGNEDKDDNTSNTALFDTAGIYFGGNEHSLHTTEPKYYVLHHSNDDTTTTDIGCELLPGLNLMSVQEAKEQLYYSKYDTLTTYSGHLLWDTSDLEAELESNMWTCLSVDSWTFCNALLTQKKLHADENNNDDNALRKYLLSQISSKHRINATAPSARSSKKYNRHHLHTSSFDQRMFEEWSRTHLTLAGENQQESEGNNIKKEETKDLLLQPGDLLRSTDTSSNNDFLFYDQEFQKSLVLILQDDADLTVGVLLSHPTTNSCDLVTQQFFSSSFPTKARSASRLPVRYGGDFLHFLDESSDEQEDEEQTEIPSFCLHYLGGVVGGEPIGSGSKTDHSTFHIYKASIEDASKAIAMGVASATDFLIVQGMTIWPKTSSDSSSSIGASGYFERIPPQHIPKIWDSLSIQKPLSPLHIESNINIARQAWSIATSDDSSRIDNPTAAQSPLSSFLNMLSNNDNDNTKHHYQQQIISEKKKTKRKATIQNDLAFDAIKTWLAVYLLQDPNHRP